MINLTTFKELMVKYKLTRQKTATLLHVAKFTVDYWLSKKEVPDWALIFLKRKLKSPMDFPRIADATLWLKQIKSAQALTQIQVAEFLGVKVNRVYQWAENHNAPAWAAESLMLALLLDKTVILKMKRFHHEQARKERLKP